MSINNPDFFEKVKKQIEEFDWDAWEKKQKQEYEDGQRKVANKEYCDWLVKFLDNLEQPYDDECWMYKNLAHKEEYSDLDIENEKYLGNFYSFLRIVAKEQNVKEFYDDSWFEEKGFAFIYKSRLYEYDILIGQGSATTIGEVKESGMETIDLDKYFLHNLTKE